MQALYASRSDSRISLILHADGVSTSLCYQGHSAAADHGSPDTGLALIYLHASKTCTRGVLGGLLDMKLIILIQKSKAHTLKSFHHVYILP